MNKSFLSVLSLAGVLGFALVACNKDDGNTLPANLGTTSGSTNEYNFAGTSTKDMLAGCGGNAQRYTIQSASASTSTELTVYLAGAAPTENAIYTVTANHNNLQPGEASIRGKKAGETYTSQSGQVIVTVIDGRVRAKFESIPMTSVTGNVNPTTATGDLSCPATTNPSTTTSGTTAGTTSGTTAGTTTGGGTGNSLTVAGTSYPMTATCTGGAGMYILLGMNTTNNSFCQIQFVGTPVAGTYTISNVTGATNATVALTLSGTISYIASAGQVTVTMVNGKPKATFSNVTFTDAMGSNPNVTASASLTCP